MLISREVPFWPCDIFATAPSREGIVGVSDDYRFEVRYPGDAWASWGTRCVTICSDA